MCVLNASDTICGKNANHSSLYVFYFRLTQYGNRCDWLKDDKFLRDLEGDSVDTEILDEELRSLSEDEPKTWVASLYLEIGFRISDSKVHGANMGPIWGRQDPGVPHVGPTYFAVWDMLLHSYSFRLHDFVAAMSWEVSMGSVIYLVPSGH